jgi:lipopolysaccharide export system protein LptC
MAVSDNLYSRLVTWLKIMLPLAALALLSTLFLFARGSQTDVDIPYATIEEIAREPRISGPRFAGIAADGSVVAMSADSIRPLEDRPDSFAVADIRLEIDTPEGTRIDMRAGNGELDGRARVARLTALVSLAASGGYQMETTGMEADLDTGALRSLGPLEVRTPFGSLTAGNLTVAAPQAGGARVMVFNDGVRLLYEPQP